ncbi:MAG: OstA-like protein [Bacteroidota bacterium]
MWNLSPLVYKSSLLTGSLFILSILLINPQNSHAQRRITIQQADQILAHTLDGEKVQKLIGNVIVSTDSLTMVCDSAYNYNQRRVIEAFGNIEIQTTDEWIWADSLYYNLETDLSNFNGRVVVVNDSTTIFGEQLRYSFSSDIAQFDTPILLEDNRGRLRANRGIYYQQQDSAQFYGQVQVADSNQYLESDSLYTNRSTGSYQLFDRVYIHDRKNRTKLNGDQMEADSTGRRLIIGNAYIESRSDSSDTTATDTTLINAQRILVLEGEASRTIDATNQVKIWSTDFSAIGDSARYVSHPEQFRLWSNPLAWHEFIQLTAPRINAYLTENNLDSLEAYPQPFAVQRDTALERLNQIKGDTLLASFAEGEVRTIHTFPNSEMIYFTKNENEQPDGAIKIQSSAITIKFRDGAVHTFTAQTEPKGSFLPESPDVVEQRLDGFSWNPERRPTRSDFSMRNNRKWGPIPKKAPFAQNLPYRYETYLNPQKDPAP